MNKLIPILLTISLLLSLAACGAAPVQTDLQATAAPPETEGTPDAPYPMTLTDQAGREVMLSAEPRRIVSAYYISSSALIALGLQDRMAGIENKPEKRPIYGLSAPELLMLPNMGTAKELDLEGCLAAEPDLVILPLKLKEAALQLEQLGVPVLLVNPESQELLLEMVDLIAKAADVKARAGELRGFISEQAARLSAVSGETPAVYLGGNSSLLSTAGAAMYQSGLITLAGGRNVAESLPDTYWAEVSYEQLLSWDPEYIVLAADAAYSVEDVLNDPNLSDCRAVRSGNVFRIPNDIESWDSPVPAGILGAVWLASVLHPEEVTPEYLAETTSVFYEEFYGFTKAN